MAPENVRKPGRYHYQQLPDQPADLVEVVDRGEALYVRFEGRDDEDLLTDLAGDFEGPLPA